MWVFALAGAVLMVFGWGAYAGWNRRWLSRPGIYAGYLGPALVGIGGGLVLMGLSEPVARIFATEGPTTTSGWVFAVLFFGGLVIAFGSHFLATSGMPARWRPGWVREIEGLSPRAGDPDPDPLTLAPDWATIHHQVPAAVGTGYTPPLDLVPQRSVAAVINAPWGGAARYQQDPEEQRLLQMQGLLTERLTPTPQGALMSARLHRDDARALVIEANPPTERSVVATVVQERIAVLELRERWGTRRDQDAGRGGFDVVAFSGDDALAEHLITWVSAAPAVR